ncbi:phenylacetyl-CoA ligase [Marasmius fiardii PR-910]|nr:phenylacetyl-CoA ligase [Marasmius fiardii PR-910]
MADLICPTKSAPDILPLPVIPSDLTLAHFIFDHCCSLESHTTHGEHPCLIEEKSGRMIALEEVPELRSRTLALAAVLRSEYGIDEDDVVLISIPNHVDYPVLVWATHLLGAIVTLSNPNFTVEELSFHIRLTKPSIIIAHLSALETAQLCAGHSADLNPSRVIALERTLNGAPNVADLILSQNMGTAETTFQGIQPREGLANKVAALCLSSGTTGLPKVIRITHRSFIANIIQMNLHTRTGMKIPSGLRTGDVALGVLPFYHAAGLVINLHFLLYSGLSIVVVEKYNFFEMLDSISRFRITTLILVPPQAVSLCKHPATRLRDLGTVRYVIVGAAPVPKEVQRLLHGVFPKAQIGQAYGATEATCTIAMHSSREGPPGSAGKIVPGVEISVYKSDGSLAGVEEIGELYVRSPSVALGYLDNDVANQETFDKCGWLRTGDQVRITSDGYIFVHDRTKDFIKVKGFQVAPAELEGCLLDHPEVADVCVVGIPDTYCGEVPRAFVVLSSSTPSRTLDLESVRSSIIQHLGTRKSSYKHLRGGVEFVTSIPKTSSGKILRRVIRNEFVRESAKL